MTHPADTVTDSPDGHRTTVTGGQYDATASCAGCHWDGSGQRQSVEGLATSHAQNKDGSR